MQLTKNEIAETQIIVTTPEKWDVVTRKPTGEGEVASVSAFILVKQSMGIYGLTSFEESEAANHR